MPAPRTWRRRLLLVAALIVGLWALLAASVDAAHADEGDAAGSTSCDDAEIPDGGSAVPPVADPAPDGAQAPVSIADAGAVVVLADLPSCAWPLDQQPGDSPGPPAALPTDVPVAEVPAAPAGEDPAPAAPSDPPAPPVATDVGAPAPEAPAPETPAPETPAPETAIPETAEAVTTDVAAAAAAEVAPVPDVSAVPQEYVFPALCSDAALDSTGGTEVRGPSNSVSGAHGQHAAAIGPSTAGLVLPADAWPSGAPASQPISPAPLSLPVPPAPAPPVGQSAAASVSISAGGSGQAEHQDSTYAVLADRMTASGTPGSGRTASGFAGNVVGGADDPGVRPG